MQLAELLVQEASESESPLALDQGSRGRATRGRRGRRKEIHGREGRRGEGGGGETGSEERGRCPGGSAMCRKLRLFEVDACVRARPKV